ncbi:MAG: hydrogenase 3 maturation endopeptidase HyCI [Candidatus Bathyarchaeota archaeon]|nr:hydrogenase 3 maturation endopeptidase HyCI [Candidatus Termiticorpusculum sp.]
MLQVYRQLKDWLSHTNRVVIAGIGNPIRNDDFIGTKIVQQLQGKLPDNVCLIECETVPENYIFEIKAFKPSHVLLIDAAMLELEPGEARLVFPEQMTASSAFSSHALPLRMFSDYLKETTGTKIALLLIQPKNIEFGETITTELKKAAERIESLLTELLYTLA